MNTPLSERKLKLIWDFRGPEAAITARHHAAHLKDFIITNSLLLELYGTETVNDMHSIAYLVVYESEMPAVRDALKPHRGQVYSEPQNN